MKFSAKHSLPEPIYDRFRRSPRGFVKALIEEQFGVRISNDVKSITELNEAVEAQAPGTFGTAEEQKRNCGCWAESYFKDKPEKRMPPAAAMVIPNPADMCATAKIQVPMPSLSVSVALSEEHIRYFLSMAAGRVSGNTGIQESLNSILLRRSLLCRVLLTNVHAFGTAIRINDRCAMKELPTWLNSLAPGLKVPQLNNQAEALLNMVNTSYTREWVYHAVCDAANHDVARNTTVFFHGQYHNRWRAHKGHPYDDAS